MPAGDVVLATAIGSVPFTGSICSRASCSSNQSAGVRDDLAVEQADDHPERLVHPRPLGDRVDAHHHRVGDQRARPDAEHRPAVASGSRAARSGRRPSSGGGTGRLTTPEPSRMRWVRCPAAARNTAGSAMFSHAAEWCSPTHASSKPEPVAPLDQLEVAAERDQRALADRVVRRDEHPEAHPSHTGTSISPSSRPPRRPADHTGGTLVLSACTVPIEPESTDGSVGGALLTAFTVKRHMALVHDVEVIEDPAAAAVALDPVRARLLAELAEPGVGGDARRPRRARPPEGQLPPPHARGARPRRAGRGAQARRHHRARAAGHRRQLRRVARRARRAAPRPRAGRRPPLGPLPRRARRPRRARGRQPRPPRRRRRASGCRRWRIDTEIRFRSAADRAAFADELTAAVLDLAARYHHDDGRPHRLVVAAHPDR